MKPSDLKMAHLEGAMICALVAPTLRFVTYFDVALDTLYLTHHDPAGSGYAWQVMIEREKFNWESRIWMTNPANLPSRLGDQSYSCGSVDVLIAKLPDILYFWTEATRDDFGRS